jgi:hypothetical protein
MTLKTQAYQWSNSAYGLRNGCGAGRGGSALLLSLRVTPWSKGAYVLPFAAVELLRLESQSTVAGLRAPASAESFREREERKAACKLPRKGTIVS